MKKRIWIIYIALVFVGYVVSSSQAGTIQSDLQASLNNLSPEEEISVIVTLTDQLDLKQFKNRNRKFRRSNLNRALRNKADKSQKSLHAFLKKKNVRKIKAFWIFNGMAVTLRADQVAELARRPDVQSVSLDAILSIPQPLTTLTSEPEWNLKAINAPDLWAKGYTGTGVVVATMDTGVDVDHPDLASRWRGGTNSWFDPNLEYDTPHDSNGHGTQTMGVMVGGDEGGSTIGVAPGAKWIAVKIFNDAEEALTSVIHDGFQWLLDPDGDPATDDLPDVVNNSWGYPALFDQCYSEFQSDVQALKAAGVAVVFSAGNSGPDPSTSLSPANYPESFAVGSVDEQLLVASHSSRGPSPCPESTIFPELVAPGVNIRTAGLTFNGAVPGSYVFATGTSFAAPHVSGAMALLLSVDPLLTVAELEAALISSATDTWGLGDDNDYGYGLLNVAAASSLFTFLNVSVTERGGSIVSDSPGINCPGDCQGAYLDGTVVTLTAIPTSSGTFTGWSGDCTGMELTCQVTMDQVKNVSAEFLYSFPWNLFIPNIIR